MRNEKLGQATDFDDPSLRNELYKKTTGGLWDREGAPRIGLGWPCANRERPLSA